MGLEPLQNPQRGLCRERAPKFFFLFLLHRNKVCTSLVAEVGRKKKSLREGNSCGSGSQSHVRKSVRSK